MPNNSSDGDSAQTYPTIIGMVINGLGSLNQNVIVKIIYSLLQNIPSKRKKIDLINSNSLALLEGLFEGFTGVYLTYNAPLSLDYRDIATQLKVHLNRYQSNNFVTAKYYYPIFAHKNKKTVKDWVESTKTFFERLSSELAESHSKKIVFYVPRKDYLYEEDHIMSFFLGKKSGKDQCIAYIHNELFMQDLIPKSIFVFYENERVNEITTYIVKGKSAPQYIEEPLSIKDFLDYLKELERELKAEEKKE